jgi:hypothetical protein
LHDEWFNEGMVIDETDDANFNITSSSMIPKIFCEN